MLYTIVDFKNNLFSLIKFALPIIFGQLGQMLIGAGDVLIASLYNTQSVAAIGIANGVFNPLFLFGIGLTMGISPTLSYLRAKNAESQCTLKTVFLLCLGAGIILTFMTLLLVNFVPVMGFDSKIVPSIEKYITIVAWSIPFVIIFHGLKEYLQAFEEVFFPNALTLLAVFVNLAANYILVFGFLGFEGLGEVGLAIASLSIRVFLCIILILYMFKFKSWGNYAASAIKPLLKISLPIAFMFFLEVLAFCMVTIFSGQISILAAATNNIIMTLAATAFMIPLALSSAVAVKVGYAYGEKSYEDILLFLKSVMFINVFYLIMTISVFLFLPRSLLNLVTQDPEVISLGVSLLFIVAIFQISDTTQVIFAGILRGLKQTRSPSVTVFVSYWVIGIPFGHYLAFECDQGAAGLWIGLAVALSFCALTLCFLTLLRLKNLPSEFE